MIGHALGALQLFAQRKALVGDKFPAVRDTQAGELPKIAASILSSRDRILTDARPSLSACRRLRLQHATLLDAAGVQEAAFSVFRADIEGALRALATAAISGKQRREPKRNEHGQGVVILWHSRHRIAGTPGLTSELMSRG